MSSKKVLIVEDEMIIALLIERMVTNLGHEVVDKVSSGEDAVAAALENEPDIILMDIRLQGEIDGIEAMIQIRKNKNIPVIYISGNTDAAYKEKVEQTDYIEFLSKPITISDLNRSFDCAS
jgi:CheY-like chemotaxis protein